MSDTDDPPSRVLLLNFEGLNSTHDFLACNDFRTMLEAISGAGSIHKVQLYPSKNKMHPSAFVECASLLAAQQLRLTVCDKVVKVGGVPTIVNAIYSNKQEIDIQALKATGKDYVTGVGDGKYPPLRSSDGSGGAGVKRMRVEAVVPQAGPQQPLQVALPFPLRLAAAAAAANGKQPQQLQQLPQQQEHHSVLFVSNLRPGTSPEVIFRLFSICGNVKAVKLHFNNRTNCFVQYFRSEAEARALEVLNGIHLYGRALQVEHAANQKGIIRTKPEVAAEQDEDLELFFDETSSGQRYPPGSDVNVPGVRPTNVLKITRYPETSGRDVLEDLAFRFWRSDKEPAPTFEWTSNDSATLTYSNVPAATSALVGMHSVVLEPSKESICVMYASPRSTSGATISRLKGQFIPDPTISDEQQRSSEAHRDEYLPDYL